MEDRVSKYINSSALPAPPNTTRNVLRVGIHSLASPSWQSKTPHVSGIG